MLSTLKSVVSDNVLVPLKPHVQQLQEWTANHPRLALSSAGAALAATYLASSAIRKTNLPPGPRPLPFLGSRHLLDYSKIHESLQRLGNTYGDVFTVYVYSNPFIILNSYSAIKEGFVSDRYLMAGRPFEEDYLAAMNEEVFMGDYSDHWKLAKKSGITALKKFAGPQSEIEDIMLQEVDFLIDAFTQTVGTPMALKPTFLKATGNITSSFIFGVHYDDHADPEFLNFLKLIDDWYLVMNGTSPGDQFDPLWMRRLRFKQEHKLFESTCQQMRDHCKMVMERVKDSFDPENPRSLLEYYMATRDMEPMGGLDGFCDTICLYTVDPVDTMAVLLQWGMLYLAYFPDVQERLQQLTDKVVGAGQQIQMEHRGDLGLVESFLHEVQRHCNLSVYSFGHTCTKEGAKFRGYDLPQDALIHANFYAVHMDPEIHPQPEKFIADRFMDNDGKFRRADSVFTFSAGSRSCPGDMHTRMEIFLVVSNLVHHFKVSFPAGEDKPELRMQDKSFFKIPHPFKVVFTER